jgi:hypothetical protein
LQEQLKQSVDISKDKEQNQDLIKKQLEEQLSTQIEINQKQAAMMEAKKLWKKAIKKEVEEKVALLKQQ